MKRITFLKSLFLLFALIVGSMNGWADNVTFNRVTEAPTDWSGEYLIVSEKQPTMAYDGSKTGTNLGTNGDLFIVTANASTITGDYSAKTFIIAKSSTDGKYTIKSKSGYYIGRTSNSNGLDQSTTTTYDNTISISNSLVTITSSAGPKLQFYNSSGSYTFKYYKSAQSAIRLYKIEETTTTYSLTFSATGGTITATNATTSAAVASESQVAEGATLNITAVPNPGYIFTGWTSSPAATFGDASSASTTYVMPTADAILTANFEADETDYVIHLTQTTGGTIGSSTSTAKTGTEITLTPTPDSGYRFVSWTVLDKDLNEVTITNNKFIMPASNVEIVGTFANEYAITINPTENGSIVASPTAGIAGETITLTATPAANYALNTVTVTDADAGNVEVSGTGKTRTFTMPAKAVNVTATFYIPKGSFLDPYTVAQVWEMYNANNNISIEGWVTGYIVGSVPQSNQAIATTSGHSATTLALMDTPTILNPNTKVENRTDLLVIQIENNNIISKNNNLINHSEHIGKPALIKGTIKKYYGIAGVNPSTIIKIGNMMTLKGTINSTADIPGYTDDGSMVYYVKTNEEVNAKNVIHENPGATTLTVDEYVLSDDNSIYIPYDITANKVTNNRTLYADADAYTWYEPYAYTLPVGNKAYSFAGVNGNTLSFTETGLQELAANTPYLIIANDDVNGSVNSSVTVKATPANNTSGGEHSDWQFVGSYNYMTPAEAAAADMWALGSSNKWKYYTGSDTYGVFPRRCYMINSTNKVAGAKQFETIFGGETTYIELVNKTNPEESRIYTLDGRYVGTKKDVLKNGVYVSNGKKFVIK